MNSYAFSKLFKSTWQKRNPLEATTLNLLISYQQPHKPVTTDTNGNARWLKTFHDEPHCLNYANFVF
jgi:hypothetical protein